MIDGAFRNNWITAHAQTLTRLGIIGVCLALSLLIGRLAMNGPVWLLLGGLLGLAVLLRLAFKPDLGVLALVISTLFLKVGFSTGTQSPITFSLALTGALFGAWIVRLLIEHKRLRLQPLPVNKPIILFMLAAGASFVWSSLMHDPLVDNWDTFFMARVGGLGTLILSPAAMLLVANHVQLTRHLKVIVGAFVLAGMLGLIQAYANVKVLPTLNLSGLFPLWFVTLTAGQALFNQSLSPRARLVLGLTAAASFYFQFVQAQTWKSGWIPPLIGLFVLTALRSRKMFGVLIAATLLFVLVRFDYLSESLQAEDQESGVTRTAAWELNWLVTREHLLLGTGPAGYAPYYMSYFPSSAMATHNNYIDILSETGIIGFTFFAWFLAAAGYAVRGMLKHVPPRGFEHGLATGLAAGFVGVVVAMMLGDWFLPFPYTQGIAGYDYTVWGWLMIGLIMVLYRRYVIPAAAGPAPR